MNLFFKELQLVNTIEGAIKELEKKRNNLRRELFDKQDEIDSEKDKLLDTVQSRLESESSIEELFTLKWKLV